MYMHMHWLLLLAGARWPRAREDMDNYGLCHMRLWRGPAARPRRLFYHIHLALLMSEHSNAID